MRLFKTYTVVFSLLLAEFSSDIHTLAVPSPSISGTVKELVDSTRYKQHQQHIGKELGIQRKYNSVVFNCQLAKLNLPQSSTRALSFS